MHCALFEDVALVWWFDNIFSDMAFRFPGAHMSSSTLVSLQVVDVYTL